MFSTLVSLAVLCSTAFAAPSPGSATFATALLNPGRLGSLSGSVLFTAAGEGVNVALAINGFPSEGGPFPYHGTSPDHMILMT